MIDLEALVGSGGKRPFRGANKPSPVVSARAKSTSPAAHRSEKASLALLQRAVGTNHPLPIRSAAPPESAVAVAADRSAFPLDDSEFREF